MAKGVRPTRVMRGGRWHSWDEAVGDFVPEGTAAGPPAPPPVEVALRHERGIDRDAIYRLRVVAPTTVHGQLPEVREITVPGANLIDTFLGPNRYWLSARFIDTPPVCALLDTLNVSADLHWCSLDEVPGKLADGFVLLDDRGYVTGYGPHAGSALAAKIWSAWRRKAEAEASEVAAQAAPPAPELGQEIPVAAAPPRRGSPWRRRSEEVKSDG